MPVWHPEAEQSVPDPGKQSEELEEVESSGAMVGGFLLGEQGGSHWKEFSQEPPS